jgi:uncharacterized protein (TIGR02757 family)
MNQAPQAKLKAALDLAFNDYHHEKQSRLDPISLVYPFANAQDREVVAFFVALISYGNVTTILKSGEKLLLPLGKNPFNYLQSNKRLDLWRGFKHRFTTGYDIEILAHWVRGALKAQGSLEGFFVHSNSSPLDSMKVKLSRFVRTLTAQPLPSHLKPILKLRSRNLKYLLSDPDQGSACKRLNMFLRWVVRPKDGVDLGLWKQISTKELMLPLDTHIVQTLKKLKWIRTENTNWKTVETVTQKLRKISDSDPIRYDFALCHLSMSGGNFKNYQKLSKPLES